MKKFIILCVCLTAVLAISQDIIDLKSIKPDKEYDNILVKAYSTDKNQSSYIIWINNEVRLHKHVRHTENLYIISGKGELTVGQKKLNIKKGDYINIPKNTPHGLIVTSSKPIKVLSIQSPQFLGIDRVFLDE